EPAAVLAAWREAGFGEASGNVLRGEIVPGGAGFAALHAVVGERAHIVFDAVGGGVLGALGGAGRRYVAIGGGIAIAGRQARQHGTGGSQGEEGGGRPAGGEGHGVVPALRGRQAYRATPSRRNASPMARAAG